MGEQTGPKKYTGPFRIYSNQQHSKLANTVPLGSRFGHLVVQGKPFAVGLGRSTWTHVVCLCDCGQYDAVQASHLANGYRTSCGCMLGKHPNARQWKHGEYGTRLNSIWRGMCQRCRNSRTPNYGGKGIHVCQAWGDYTIFRDWAKATGYKDGLTIDRINPDGDYCPANCQWMTKSENSRKIKLDRDAKSAAKDRLIDSLSVALIASLSEATL